MRRALSVLPLILLSACQDEPDFDTRYDKATKEIEARAKAMDAAIAESDRAAGASRPLPDVSEPSNAAPSSGE